jgi:hypothetical protein
MYSDKNDGYQSGLDGLSRPSNGDWGAWKAGTAARQEQQFFSNQSTPDWGGANWSSPQTPQKWDFTHIPSGGPGDFLAGMLVLLAIAGGTLAFMVVAYFVLSILGHFFW